MKPCYTHVVQTRTSGLGISFDRLGWVGSCESVQDAVQLHRIVSRVHHFYSTESFHLLFELIPTLLIFIWQQLTPTNADYPGRYDHSGRGIVSQKLHPSPWAEPVRLGMWNMSTKKMKNIKPPLPMFYACPIAGDLWFSRIVLSRLYIFLMVCAISTTAGKQEKHAYRSHDCLAWHRLERSRLEWCFFK